MLCIRFPNFMNEVFFYSSDLDYFFYFMPDNFQYRAYPWSVDGLSVAPEDGSEGTIVIYETDQDRGVTMEKGTGQHPRKSPVSIPIFAI